MFATRDQENLIHNQQTTAAGKPLNQNVRAMQPKTPGNNLKTPFRARNDENKPLAFQGLKLGLKDGPSKFDVNSFVTPAGPRNRAPLGAKTTNAKAQNFKTPGPGLKNGKAEKSSSKLSNNRRSARKIVVAPSETIATNLLESKEIEDDEPDYGYAPPAEIPMPDPPMDFPEDSSFPYLKHQDLLSSYRQVFFSSPKDETGFSIRLKKEEEMDKRTLEEQKLELYEQAKMQLDQAMTSDPDEQVEAMMAAGPRGMSQLPTKRSSVGTVKARSAAVALSEPDSLKLPAAATRETASSLQKKKKPAFTVLGAKSAQSLRPVNVSVRAPVTLGKNTIGFPKAKKPPTILPSPDRVRSRPGRTAHEPRVQQSSMHPREFVELYGEPPEESEMWFRLKRHELFEREATADEQVDTLADDLFDTDFLPGGLEGMDDEDVFQLPMPET